MEPNLIHELADDDLNKVAGGFLKVSAWIEYANSSIIPSLYGLRNRACPADASIISQSISVLSGTMTPGANVAGPVQNLWASYCSTYRAQMSDFQIRNELESVLYRAKSYIDTNA